ncbi:MAG: UDP-N-acetylmuramate--L-alanine ligase [Ruminococcaceae bacterium]|nr:UDP-N-acetylmuramate--L-alanine ligase [Oscillospiraceae bacterium]
MKKLTNFFNFLEQKPSIFFLGIGGVSMSSLAFTAKRYGCKVSGYDAAESDTTAKLMAEGIPVYRDFDESRYKGVELVVYTGAIREDDVVFSYPKSLGIPMMPRAKFLGLLMKQCKNPIGVSGTHGKSSTTGMLSSIFMKAEDRDPTVMAGAVLPELDSTYRLGDGEDFLFEACEYQNSFLDFFPHLAVVLNVEHDHADFFPTLEDVIASFVKFTDIAKNGYAVFNRDNEGAMEVASRTVSPKFFFSAKEKADLWCEDLREEKGFYAFDIHVESGLLCSVKLAVPGEHSVSNALAAASAAYLSGVNAEAIRQGLEAFRGVKRRFEYRGRCNNMEVFDDYAHHPDEIRATLLATKKLGYPHVTVVFQPHTYTRTRAYWADFVSSLSLADEVILADIYPAREAPLPGIESKLLAEKSDTLTYRGGFEQIAAYLRSLDREGLLLIMGAGTIVSLTDLILDQKTK